MKQNVTLSLDKEILRKGKIIAAEKKTSISRMVSETLREIVEKEDQYEAAKRSALQTLEEGFHLGGGMHWKREDLYEE
jgi:predicted transcriptional regulator